MWFPCLGIDGSKLTTTNELIWLDLIPGIIRRVGYLNTLGMNTLGLGPMFSSANHWEGRDYDVTDFKAVDERYGTLEDFDILIKAIHKQGNRESHILVIYI